MRVEKPQTDGFSLMGIESLIGGLEHLDSFSHHIGNFIIPTDDFSNIFQRGRAQPPTRLLLIIINHILTIIV